MADDIRGWSDELARDPSSIAFLPLGEALRRQGQLDLAQRVAVRGLERHPQRADAHDLLARIHVDRGDIDQAFVEWDTVLRLMPDHVGALKGMAFVCFQQGRLEDAEGYLRRAALDGTPDAGIGAALDTLRRRSTSIRAVLVGDAPAYDPADPRAVFAPVLDGADQTAMLLDATGMVLAGIYATADGRDLAQEIGAELSGVSDEADRATRHFGLGAWKSIVFETETAVVALAPAARDGLLVLAASRATPLGQLRRLLDQCAARAADWLGAGDQT
jgi:predicted regulator of Ras-like GTPase activity (Roadblock/LC7/MglB family)